MDKKNSGVGVLDKAVTILGTLESGPHSLAELVAATGIARPTAHRLAVALEHHRLVARDLQGRFVLGPRSAELAAAAGEDRLLAAAAPALAALRDATGESAQRRGWAQSVGEREAGVASVSAPVKGPNGKVIAAVSISGPIERLGRQPGRVHAAAVVATAARLTEHLAKS